jgi:hypothetical protein
MINEFTDDEMNKDVDACNFQRNETSELIVFRQTFFKFKHIRHSSLLANTDVSVDDVMLT